VSGSEEEPLRPRFPDLRRQLNAELDQIAAQLQTLAQAKNRLQDLLEAVLSFGRELDLDAVLHRLVTTAMELVGARYGALGVLDESGEHLQQFLTAGLSEQELADLDGLEFPRGRGLLGHLMRDPAPLRVDDIASHPDFVGFPPGHPRMRTLLGVAVGFRGEIYGDLYLSERYDGQPFDATDEGTVVTLATAAGIAIENAHLFRQVRESAEQFQRLLLPTLPDLRPFEAAAVYRPAAEPGGLGGDWYDAILLPDNAVGIVVGDVVGHDLHAAAAMAAARNMLRALLFDRRTPPSAILTRLDRTVVAITDIPVTTTCLARVEPEESGWMLHWSSAGHLPPLLITSDHRAEYLYAEPGLPLGVDTEQHRPDHARLLPPGGTVIFFTDGLVEHLAHTVDQGLDALADLAVSHAGQSPDTFVQALADHHPSDGHDDMTILALRIPASV
jgi:hypothetical protein